MAATMRKLAADIETHRGTVAAIIKARDGKASEAAKLRLAADDLLAHLQSVHHHHRRQGSIALAAKMKALQSAIDFRSL